MIGARTQRIPLKVNRLSVALATPAMAASLWASAPAAGATPAVNSAGAACATVSVTARPKVNAQNAPNETIKSPVTNCGTRTETVILDQTLSGPFVGAGPTLKSWTLTLTPGQTSIVVRRVPYSCCGTYDVHDTVLSRAGRTLAKASTSFTFA